MARPRGALALAVACAALALAATPASAVTFTVNNERDMGDLNLGDNQCGADTSPPNCTLRAAIEQANALAGGDRVIVPPGDYHLTTAETLTITQNLQIDGAGARSVTVRQTQDPSTGDASDRVFYVLSGTVTLEGMTIRDGRADNTNGFFGGNVRNEGTLNLVEVTVTNGEGDSAGGVANVGGTLNIERSTISGNTAPANAFEGGDAGAVLNFGTATDAASLRIETSTISSNTARLVGGIFSYNNDGNTVEIRNSTIAGNQSGDRGGGGGIGIGLNGGTATFENSIVSGNTSTNGVPLNCSADAGAEIISAGNNLESGSECGFDAGGDIRNADPLLGTLTNNTGPTNTHALGAGSPALEAADDAACLTTDQRGFSRPQGAHCDIGAYELDRPPDTTITGGPSGRTNDPTPRFTFTSNEPGSPNGPFECRVDNAPFGPCSALSSHTITPALADGIHTIRVRAMDETGNVDPTPAARTFRVDTVAPPTPTLSDSDPDSPNNNNQPELKGTAEADATVSIFNTAACTGTPVATGSAAQFAGAGITVNVADNTTRVFRVTATDLAGNESACSAPLTYVEDSLPPDTQIDSGPSGVTGDTTPTFTFSSADATRFECRFDGAPFGPCTSAHTSPATFADGPHTFDVQGRDAAGNVDPTPASRPFVVDTGPPETTILSGPAGLTTDSTPTFEFSSDEPGSTFECSLDDGPFAACTSPFTPQPLSSGPHSFVVRAIDAAGNATAAPPREFTLIGDPEAPPELGQSFNAEAVSGEIFVSVPEGAATAALRPRAAQLPPGYQPPVKGRVFVPLSEVRQLPVGSLVDTRFGTSRLVSARNRRGRTQAGRFSAGVFQVLQSRNRRAKGLTELKLKGSGFDRCRRGARGSGGASAAQLSRRTIRRLRSSARGRFRTRGRHSAATVRGTIWITADRCDGTLTTVKRGAVAVRDFRRKRTIEVRAGKSYLARAN